MFTVALIGPDGVGKSTISRQLEGSLPLPARYVYMGVNVEASNVALPTSRWLSALRRRLGKSPNAGGPLEHARANESPRGFAGRIMTGVKRSLRLVNQVAEESYRQVVVSWYLLHGFIVVLDRDFFADYYAYDIADDACKSYTRRIHGFLLKHFYRRPDLFIYLDADPQTMFARKGEGTLELLEQRRHDYLALQQIVEHFAIVDAAQPLDDVVSDVTSRIRSFQKLPSPRKRHRRRGATADQREGVSS